MHHAVAKPPRLVHKCGALERLGVDALAIVSGFAYAYEGVDFEDEDCRVTGFEAERPNVAQPTVDRHFVKRNLEVVILLDPDSERGKAPIGILTAANSDVDNVVQDFRFDFDLRTVRRAGVRGTEDRQQCKLQSQSHESLADSETLRPS
jgi:hypothetical protein